MDGMPRIMALAHDVLCADYIEGAERAFYALALEDLQAAQGLAEVLIRSLSGSAPLWMAILDRARYEVVERPKPFDWSQRDAMDTAAELAARMGWRDMERQA